MSDVRILAAAAALCLPLAACKPPLTARELLERATAALEEAGGASITMTGSSDVTTADKPATSTAYNLTGTLRLPDRWKVQGTISGGDQSASVEVITVGQDRFARTNPTDKWRKTQVGGGPTSLIDPTLAVGLPVLRNAEDVKEVEEDGELRRLRLTPTDADRAAAQDRLLAGGTGVAIAIEQIAWIDEKQMRIVRVIRRYTYSGQATGHASTDLTLRTGAPFVTAPPASEVEEAPAANQ